MRTSLAIVLATAMWSTAGCLGDAGTAGDDGVPVSVAGALAGDAGAASWFDEPWEGYFGVGAAYDIPAHLQETHGPMRAVWSPSFHYEVLDVPHALEVRLDWTAAASSIEFMVELPDDGSGKVSSVISESVPEGPLCMRIPASHVTPGSYAIMAHSEYAVDAHLTFTVSTLGGGGRIVDEPHAPSATAIPGYAVTGATSGSLENDVPPEACERAAR
ncbi:MAG: hypothetical protein ACT4PT_07040 [Methanobacteriota archaeon]